MEFAKREILLTFVKHEQFLQVLMWLLMFDRFFELTYK